ncbi:hypothetical protein ACHAWC_000967, partial [Mediolabrus comicus]
MMILLLLIYLTTLSVVVLAETIDKQQQQQQHQFPLPPKNQKIQIDFNYYLSTTDNATSSTISSATSTSAATTIDDDEEEEREKERLRKKYNVQRNPVADIKNFPEKRYQLWSELSQPVEKSIATQVLKYTESTWDTPYTNSIESYRFSDLASQVQSGIRALQISPEQWDCHVNHYYGYYWSELMETSSNLHVHFARLGWDQQSWDLANVTNPKIDDLKWSELNEMQRVIANELCYFEDTWDEYSLSTWIVDWRNGRKKKKRM